MTSYNEADTRAKLIDPQIKLSGWGESQIEREHYFVKGRTVTAGRIYLIGEESRRRQPRRVDYLLRYYGQMIAVLEAKDERHGVDAGLEQAKSYARMLDVPFAYSSNGHGFVEFDFFSSQSCELSSFPTPDNLWNRWEQYRKQKSRQLPSNRVAEAGNSYLTKPGQQTDPLLYPFCPSSISGKEPRYFQEVAIRHVIERILAKQKRILLTMATGTGKTFTAFQIVWKLKKSGWLRKPILFIADRVALRNQAYNAFAPYASGQADPRGLIRGGKFNSNRDLYFALYQALDAEDGGEPLFKRIPADFFGLIIIDECHRSGFGKWNAILQHFSNAIQLGMTATPKQSESIDTYAYFCSEEAEIPLDPEDPAKGTWQPSAYSYSLGQGIEDGFLATYKVHKVRTSVDKNGLQMEDAEVQGAEIYVPENSKLRDIYANQLSLVTLCGLLTDLAEDSEHPRLENVLQGANISAIAGFSLKFRMTQGTTSQRDRDEVKRLAELATHTLCLGTDYLLVFDLTNPERPIAQEIIKEFSNGLQLFKILARLSNVGDDGQSVLREVNIFLERPPSTHPESEEQDDPPLHLLDWLSDGERSFLGRMCLFTLLGETEALILLDEPEVHFNDAWKRQIVSLLDKTIEGRQSHVLITTHSSITLTDVPQEDILVLDRNGSYTSSAFNPGIRTLAANPNDIMKYIFGAPYPSGVRGITYIERVLEGISDLAPATQKKEIENLLDKIGPGYWYSVVQNKLRALERSSEQR